MEKVLIVPKIVFFLLLISIMVLMIFVIWYDVIGVGMNTNTCFFNY